MALDIRKVAVQRLGPLWALVDAAAAEQTVGVQDPRLLICKFNGLDRADLQAAVATPAVRLF